MKIAFFILAVFFPFILAAQLSIPCGDDRTGADLASPEALKALETPGDVFFSADFETDDWTKPFFDLYGVKEGRVALEKDPAIVRGGTASLRCVLKPGEGATASMCHWFGAGYDKVHFRWYCRFAEDFDQGNLMHFSGLTGTSGTNRYDGMGGAGIRPTGFDRFSSRFEPWRAWGRNEAPGHMNFYSYFPTMKEDPNMKGKFWGNQFFPASRFIPERGKWHCMEIMIKVNDPGKANGEQAAWIDGKLYGHFTGIVWRKGAEVRIKRMNLGVYIHDNPKENTVHFDDVVLSTGYIGPVKETAQ